MIEEEITALPLYDGLLAPVSETDRVRAEMEATAKRVTGFELPTSEKDLEGGKL